MLAMEFILCLPPYCDVESKSMRSIYAKNPAFQRNRRAQMMTPLRPGLFRWCWAAQSLLWMTFYTEVAKDHPNQRGISPMASLNRFPKRFKMLHCDIWYFPSPSSLSWIILKSFTIYPWDNFIFILSYHIRTSKEGYSRWFSASPMKNGKPGQRRDVNQVLESEDGFLAMTSRK